MHFSQLSWHLRVSYLLIAFPLTLVALPLYAATGSAPMTLIAATQLAVSRAPQVQAQLLRAQAAQHDEVRAGRLPDPRLAVGINNLTVTGEQAFDAAADSMTMRSIGLTQPIPSFAKRHAEKAVALADVQLAEADVTKLRLAVKRATAMAWVRVWAAESERGQLEALRAQFSLAVKLAKAKLKGGTGSATDVLAAQSAVAQLANRLTAVDAEIASARAALQRWTGEGTEQTLAAAPDFSVLPVPPATLQRNLDRQGPLLGWAAREDRAQAQFDLARAGKHPNWSVSVVYGDRIHRPDMLDVEVSMSLPLFAGSRQDQDIDARAADQSALAAAHEDARRAQRAALSSDLAEWHGDTTQIVTYRDQLLPLAADRSRTALAGYRGGGSLEPWLEARRSEIDTRVAYAEMLAAWGQAWAELAYLLPEQHPQAATDAAEPQP